MYVAVQPVAELTHLSLRFAGIIANSRILRSFLTSVIALSTASEALATDAPLDLTTGSSNIKCRHRGTGCALPARSNQGLARAALLGFELLSHDERLQAAVRRQLTGGRRAHPQGARRAAAKMQRR